MGFWSIRKSNGTVVDLSSLNIRVYASPGAGLPPVEYDTENAARGNITRVTGVRYAPRNLTLQAKATGTSWNNLHAIRQQLIDLIQPFRSVASTDPVKIRYNSGGARVLEIDAYYAGGLELTAPKGFLEEIQVKFKCYDPLWHHVNTSSIPSSACSTITFNAIVRRDHNGIWSAMQNGVDGNVYAIAEDSSGNLYIGGAFANIIGTPNVLCNYIAKYDPSAQTWTALGAGASGVVRCIKIGPDGKVYAAAGASLMCWNPSTSAWSTLGTVSGGTAVITSITLGTDGKIYIGGSFTTVSAVAAANIAVYDGSAWTALGAGTSALVRALATGLDGKIYAGGDFATAGGVTVNYFASWNGSAWSALSSGVSGGTPGIYSIAVGEDGTVYIGGSFTSAGSISAANVAAWNGYSYSTLGAGTNGIVQMLYIAPDNKLYASGSFTTADNITLPDRVAFWNGSVWLPIDIDVTSGALTAYAVHVAENGALTVGYLYSASSTARTSYSNYILIDGDMDLYPVITITGPGALYMLANWTTGDVIYFKNLTLLSGVSVTVDMSGDDITVTSNYGGNFIRYVAPGSNLASYRLIGGTGNSITFFCNDTAATATIQYVPRYSSVDGSV